MLAGTQDGGGGVLDGWMDGRMITFYEDSNFIV